MPTGRGDQHDDPPVASPDGHASVMIDEFLDRYPDTEVVEVLVPDLSGVLRGKRLPIEALRKVYAGQVSLPRGTILLDSLGEASARIPYGYHDGDPDRPVLPVAATLAPMPWAPRPSAQLLATIDDPAGQPWFANPRAVLAHCLSHFASLGLRPVVAIELEFTLLLAANGELPKPMTTGGDRPGWAGPQTLCLEHLADFDTLFLEIEAAAAAQNIALGSALSEFGAGQFEINLEHSSDVLAACDQAILLKRLIRLCALKHGCLASFMAKPLAGHAGNGLHVHVSLLDENGVNVFGTRHDEPDTASRDPDEAAGSPLAPALAHAIGGVLATLPDSMALLAPNANSYRRFEAASFAPLIADWGRDHRGVAVRLPNADAANARFEHRAAGADANPYLVTAAVLAGVLEGLERGAGPGRETSGNTTSPDALGLPCRWHEALGDFAGALRLHRWLGAAFCRLYLTVKQDEEAACHRDAIALDSARYLRLM